MLYTLRKMEQKTVDQEMQGKRKKNFKKKEKKKGTSWKSKR